MQPTHAAQHGDHNIMMWTVDTDVVVLAVSVAQGFQPEEFWLTFGTGKYFRYLACHELADELGQEKAQALPLTGRDTVSSVSGHGKKTGKSGP